MSSTASKPRVVYQDDHWRVVYNPAKQEYVYEVNNKDALGNDAWQYKGTLYYQHGKWHENFGGELRQFNGYLTHYLLQQLQ